MSAITDTTEPHMDPDATPEEVNRESLARAVNNLQASEARVRRNAERVYDEARSKLVLDLLPVLDNLDRTLDAARGHETTPLVEGVTMIRGQLEAVLLHYGVERIDAKGKKFDPAAHDAVAAIPSDASHVGMVIEQLEPGYRFGAKLLRAARVAVGVAIPSA